MSIYTVLITGANRGIGLEFVKHYVEKNWQVFATCRDPEKAQELNNLSKKYSNLKIFQLDVNNSLQIKKLAHQIMKYPIDLLINNAGTLHHDDTFGNLNSEALISLYQTNAIAPLLVSQEFFEHVAASQRKQIVSITSKVASISEDQTENIIGYRMSKIALNMGMQEIAKKVKSKNIHILLITPGWVRTSMGGENARLSVEESVSEMCQVIEKARQLKSGGFYDRQGNPILW